MSVVNDTLYEWAADRGYNGVTLATRARIWGSPDELVVVHGLPSFLLLRRELSRWPTMNLTRFRDIKIPRKRSICWQLMIDGLPPGPRYVRSRGYVVAIAYNDHVYCLHDACLTVPDVLAAVLHEIHSVPTIAWGAGVSAAKLAPFLLRLPPRYDYHRDMLAATKQTMSLSLQRWLRRQSMRVVHMRQAALVAAVREAASLAACLSSMAGARFCGDWLQLPVERYQAAITTWGAVYVKELGSHTYTQLSPSLPVVEAVGRGHWSLAVDLVQQLCLAG